MSGSFPEAGAGADGSEASPAGPWLILPEPAARVCLMATVRERLETLPVAELAEVREKLRLNAEEREALEATARKLLEAWGGVDEPAQPPPPAPPAPPPTPTSVITNPMADRV